MPNPISIKPPTFGYEFSFANANKARADRKYTHIKERLIANNLFKVLGYIPLVSTIIGIGRIGEAVVSAITQEAPRSKKRIAGQILRGSVETLNLGAVFLLVDTIVTVSRYHKYRTASSEPPPHQTSASVPEQIQNDALAPNEELVPEQIQNDAPAPNEELVPEQIQNDVLAPNEELVPEQIQNDVPAPNEELVPEQIQNDVPAPNEELVPEQIQNDVPAPNEELVPEQIQNDVPAPNEELVPDPTLMLEQEEVDISGWKIIESEAKNPQEEEEEDLLDGFEIIESEAKHPQEDEEDLLDGFEIIEDQNPVYSAATTPLSAGVKSGKSQEVPRKELSRMSEVDGDELKREKYALSLKSVLEALKDDYTEEAQELKELATVPENGRERDSYYAFLAKVRELLSEELQDDHPVFKAVEARFFNAMYEYLEELVSLAAQMPIEDLAKLPMAEQFETIQKNMPRDQKANRFAVNLAKLRGTVNIAFDPHNMTNVPYSNFQFFMNGKSRTNLRFGSPTQEGWVYSATVVPEYEALIRNFSQKGKKHIDINLQNKNKKLIGNEQGRSLARENLSEKYPTTLFVATFDQDSDFYKQTGPWVAQDNANTFISSFIDQMFDSETSGFHFSQNILNDGGREKLEEVLGDVHSLIFEGKETLTVAERQAFIEISYSFLCLRLLEICDADSFNMSCKDAIDRGGKCNALLFYLLGSLNDIVDDQFQIEHTTITQAAPILVKKQVMIKSRRERYIQALEILQNVQRPQLEELIKHYRASGPRVCRQSNKKVHAISNAVTWTNWQYKDFGRFPDQKVDDKIVAGDPVSFYEHELQPASEGENEKNIYSPKGFAADTFGAFPAQVKRDFNESNLKIKNLNKEKFDDYLLEAFLDTFSKLQYDEKSRKTLTNAPEVAYKAIHAALAGCSQSFEEPYYFALQSLITDQYPNLLLATATSRDDIELSIEDGIITVKVGFTYPIRDFSGQDFAKVHTCRTFTVPVNAPEEAQQKTEIIMLQQ